MTHSETPSTEQALRESEQRLRAYLDNAPNGVFLADARGRYLDVNPMATVITGYSADELLEMAILDLVPPEAHEAGAAHFARLVENGASTGELPFIRKNGEHRWWTVDAVRIDDQRFLGFVRDTTEQRLAREELAHSLEWFRTIFHGTTEGLVLVDPSTQRCVRANRAFCAMLGYTTEEVTQLDVKDLNPAHALDRVLDNLRRQHRGGERTARDTPMLRKDGTLVYADVNGAPVSIHGQELILGVFHDVSERRALQTQLAQSDRLSSMGLLAAGIAHEINNPLTYLLYNLDALEEALPAINQALELHPDTDTDTTPQEIQEWVQSCINGTKNIREIARGLSTFSRVQRDHLVATRLSEVMEVAANMTYNEIKYRARLVKEYRRVPRVMVSDGRISQVFLNLLINAAHAIDEGDTLHNEIHISTWEEEGHACAEVRDTGHGIPTENLPHIFEPFFTTKPTGMGSGLGLAISKEIVESYDGTLEVESQVGVGTRFVVRIPIAQARGEAKAREKEVAHEPTGPRGRLLVVDDDPGIQRVLKRLLRAHEVHTADCGQDAIALLQQDQGFDVIISDVMMPRGSGVDLHEWLAAHQPDLAERVVFLTGAAFTPKARTYLESVPNIRLEKPMDRHTIRQIVADRVALRRG